MVQAKLRFNYRVIDLEFPCTEQILQVKLDDFYQPVSLEESLIIEEIKEPEYLKVLEKQEISLDQLNYLAKRLDSFDINELRQFEVAMKHREAVQIKDLINLTFNLPKYTLIVEMGNVERVGRVHFANILGGLGIDESDNDNCDFAEIGRDLLKSGKGKVTEYGILFENEEVEYIEPYNGQTFPQFVFGDCLAVVEMAYGDNTEYIYLPCDEMEIYKAQMRLNAFHVGNCDMTLSNHTIDSAWELRFAEILEMEGIYAVNALAKAIEKLSDKNEWEKLFAVSEYVDLHDSRALCVLANTLKSFIFVPNINNVEQLAAYWTENHEEYKFNPVLKDFFAYDVFGRFLMRETAGKFTSCGYVCTNGPMNIEKVLEVEDEVGPTMIGP